jgi:hypothetical protein
MGRLGAGSTAILPAAAGCRNLPRCVTGEARRVDETAVSGGLLMTSRKLDDIPAFNRAMIALFGGQREQRAAETSPQRRLEAWAAG